MGSWTQTAYCNTVTGSPACPVVQKIGEPGLVPPLQAFSCCASSKGCSGRACFCKPCLCNKICSLQSPPPSRCVFLAALEADSQQQPMLDGQFNQQIGSSYASTLRDMCDDMMSRLHRLPGSQLSSLTSLRSLTICALYTTACLPPWCSGLTTLHLCVDLQLR